MSEEKFKQCVSRLSEAPTVQASDIDIASPYWKKVMPFKKTLKIEEFVVNNDCWAILINDDNVLSTIFASESADEVPLTPSMLILIFVLTLTPISIIFDDFCYGVTNESWDKFSDADEVKHSISTLSTVFDLKTSLYIGFLALSMLGVLKEVLISHRVQAFESVWVKASYKNPYAYLLPKIEEWLLNTVQVGGRI